MFEPAKKHTDSFDRDITAAVSSGDWSRVKNLSAVHLARDPASSSACLHLAKACWNLREIDAADSAACRALAMNPALADAVLMRAWVATENGDATTAIACYRRLAELNPGAARWTLKLAQLLNWQGFMDEAIEELRTARARWPADPMLRMFLENSGLAAALGVDSPDPDDADLQKLTRNMPAARQRLRPLVSNDPKSDLLVARVETDEAALIFTGSNDGVAMSLPLFDAYMATLPISCIYLKDFRRLRYLSGVRSLAGTYEGTREALAKILRDLGVKRLSTLGNCDGGVAAIRFGVDLDASRIAAFETPTHLPPETLNRMEQGRNFKRKRLTEEVPAEMSDLNAFLQGRSHSSDIALYYERDNERDRLHADYLAALPRVTLQPQAVRQGQFLLRKMAASSGDFSAALSGMLGIVP